MGWASMSNSYDDIRKKEHIDIQIKVLQVSSGTASGRAYELTVEDKDGIQFPFIVWEKSDQGATYPWQEGHWYQLESAYGEVWPAGKELHGTSTLEISHLGSEPDANSAKVLIIPDSHLGKQQGGFGPSTWELDCAAGLHAAIDIGIEQAVDAVVHLGDLFHNDTGDGIPDSTGEVCRQALSKLADADIPFYYIRGNHEKRRGRIWMERFEDSGLARHLRSRPQVVNDTLAIYGIDFVDRWSNDLLAFDDPPADTVNLLCLHQSLEPLTGNPNPDVSATEILANANIDLDAIAVGHHHRPDETVIGETLVFCSGATERFGTSKSDPLPSVDLLLVEGQAFGREPIVLDSIP